MDLEKIADKIDLTALQGAFIEAVKADIEPGQTFVTAGGSKWKFLAEKDNVFVARHGEFTVVMTLTHLEGSKVSVTLELKDTPE